MVMQLLYLIVWLIYPQHPLSLMFMISALNSYCHPGSYSNCLKKTKACFYRQKRKRVSLCILILWMYYCNLHLACFARAKGLYISYLQHPLTATDVCGFIGFSLLWIKSLQVKQFYLLFHRHDHHHHYLNTLFFNFLCCFQCLDQ